jgi:hypothetical protein
VLGIGLRKTCHSKGRNLLWYLFINWRIQLNGVIAEVDFLLSITYNIFIKHFLSKLTKLFAIFTVDFSATYMPLISYPPYIVQMFDENERKIGEYISHLHASVKPVTQEKSFVLQTH